MTVPVDTLSGPTIHPKLIFSTNFGGGMSVNAVTMLGTAYDVGPPVVHADWSQGWSHINSSDTGTGYGFSSLTSYFGSKTLFYIQQLPVSHITGDVDNATSGQAATTLATLMSVAIQPTSMTVDPGGKELAITQIQRNGAGNPQAPLLIQRYRDDFGTTNAIPIPHTSTIAWEFDCILDSDINNLPADNSHYCVLTEMKTGDLRGTYPSGAYSSSVGSYRYATIIRKGTGGGLRYVTYLDNVAGAYGVYPDGSNPQTGFFFAPFTLATKQVNTNDIVKGGSSGVIGTAAFVELRANTWTGGSGQGVIVITGATGTFAPGEKLQIQIDGVWTNAVTVAKYYNGLEDQNLALAENKYRYNATAEGTVDLNTPLRFQVRLRLPSSRTDLSSGITQVSVTNLTTNVRTVLCDFQGGIQCGALEDPLTRIFIVNPYTSLNYEAYPGDPTIGITHKITNVKIWSDFPYPIV